MLKKKKQGDKVRVTFTLPAENGDQSVHIVGDLDNWDEHALPMKRLRDHWEAKVDLEPNREYQFRYRVNNETWRNDPEADRYTSNPYGSENSVVSTTVAAQAPRKRASR